MWSGQFCVMGHLRLGFLQDLVKKWSVGDLVLELGHFGYPSDKIDLDLLMTFQVRVW